MATVFYSLSKRTKRWLTVLVGLFLGACIAWVVLTHSDWVARHPYIVLKTGWKAGKFMLVGLAAFAIKKWANRTLDKPNQDTQTQMPSPDTQV